MMSIGMGCRQSLGRLLPPVTHDLSLRAADFTFAVAVKNITWGLLQAPVGAIGDKKTDLSDHPPAELPRHLRSGPNVKRDSPRSVEPISSARGSPARWTAGIRNTSCSGCSILARSAELALYFMVPPTPASTIVFAATMGMLWLGVIPLVSGFLAALFGTRYMATILSLSCVIHQVGSVIGARCGGLIFDVFGSYDRASQIGVLAEAAAGAAQIQFGGPARPRMIRGRFWRPVRSAVWRVELV
jgi:MFS family permease